MSQPIYSQIADDIRRMIETGALQPGAEILPESQLAESYATTRPTVAKAMAELENEGLITGWRPRVVAAVQPLAVHLARPADLTWAGEGATAGADAWVGDMRRAGLEISQEIDVSTRTAGQPAARRLMIDDHALVVQRRLVRFAGGQPHNMITFWFPLAVAQDTLLQRDGSIKEGSVAWLDKTHGPLTHRATVWSRMPAPDEKIELQIRPGVPVITVWRVAQGPDRPVMCSLAVFPADRTELEIDP